MFAEQVDLFSESGVSPLEDRVETQTFGRLTAIRYPVVALSGPAGSGKSTASAWLVSQGYKLVKFAAPLKDMCRAIGMTDDMIEGALKEKPQALLQGNTPRHAMQTLGTEWGRDCMGKNFWVDLWTRRAIEAFNEGKGVVADDCRFANEADAVKDLGGIILRLDGRGGISGSHESERVNFIADAYVQNAGTIADLHVALAKEIVA